MVLIAADCPNTGGLKAFKETAEGRAMLEATAELYAAERARVRGDFIRGRVGAGMAAQAAGLIFDAVERGELADDWVVMFHGGDNAAAIADIRREPESYDGMDCCDPAEPDYRGWANVAQIRFHNDMVRIVTQAHGGPHWYTTRPYTADDAEAKAWCAAKEGVKVFGAVPAPSVPVGVAPAEVVPPAPDVVPLDKVVSLAELVSRLAELPDLEWIGGDHHLGRGVTKAELKKEVKKARKGLGYAGEPSERDLLDREDPNATASLFMAENRPHMIYLHEEFLAWDGSAYVLVDVKFLSTQVRAFLDKSDVMGTDPATGAPVRLRFKPKKDDVAQVLASLADTCGQDSSSMTLPCWLGPVNMDVKNVVAFANGFLDTSTRVFYPPSHLLLTRNGLKFDYDPQKPEPSRFLAFLHQIWPTPAEFNEFVPQLQRMMGYLLVPDTSLEKIFIFLGAPGSGKGTLIRLIIQLIGKNNVASCSANELATGQFILDSIRGKTLLTMPDIEIDAKDARSVLARIKSISGEDSMGINRKNKSVVQETLLARILIGSNELPKLPDKAGALLRRYVPFRFRTVAAEPDPKLGEKLAAELPAIFNWALGGLEAIRAELKFTPGPLASAELGAAYHQGAPLAEFIEEHLDRVEDGRVERNVLYIAYRLWATSNHVTKLLSVAQFGSELRATAPYIGDCRPYVSSGPRLRYYTGCTLRLKTD